MGCDLCSQARGTWRSYFNPRTHVGCDFAVDFVPHLPAISIHAPTWGATPWQVLDIPTTAHFNPRTHVGCDPLPESRTSRPRDFNPRTHVGCDILDPDDPHRLVISIHAPTWGATHGEAGGQHRPAISIHAPTWGATEVENLQPEPIKFQSTHPRGVRLNDSKMMENYIDFNPRTHVGCDLRKSIAFLPILEFQSTHPRGVRLLSHQMIGF